MVRGSIAYVAQNAWIMNASVKNNILFGHHFDPEFYELTIKACALVEDLAVLPDGDRTEVGEKGISLSGGQKARLQLARAVYARADVYLLDDILSAVDQHGKQDHSTLHFKANDSIVGRHIINEVVGPQGLLKGKTRILATNSIPVLKEADHILLINDGRITEEGSYWDAIAKDGEIAALIKTVKSSADESDSPYTSSSSPIKASSGIDSGEDSDEDILSAFGEKGIISDKEIGGRASMTSLRRASTSSFGRPRKGDEELAALPTVKSRQTKEIGEKGKVKWSVYTAYAKACNARAVCVWLFTMVAVQVSCFASTHNHGIQYLLMVVTASWWFGLAQELGRGQRDPGRKRSHRKECWHLFCYRNFCLGNACHSDHDNVDLLFDPSFKDASRTDGSCNVPESHEFL
jgi:ATP-binding cassette subfamily C (CFTR/MRP) protein 1